MAKNLLITVVVILTAFTVNEVLGAARYRRNTTSANISIVANTSGIVRQLNDSLNQINGEVRTEVEQLIHELSSAGNVTTVLALLNRAIEKLRNDTSTEVRNIVIALTAERDRIERDLTTVQNILLTTVNQTINSLTEAAKTATGTAKQQLNNLILKLKIVRQDLTNRANVQNLIGTVRTLLHTAESAPANLVHHMQPLKSPLRGLDIHLKISGEISA